jgi:hypothetical protein
MRINLLTEASKPLGASDMVRQTATGLGLLRDRTDIDDEDLAACDAQDPPVLGPLEFLLHHEVSIDSKAVRRSVSARRNKWPNPARRMQGPTSTLFNYCNLALREYEKRNR